MSEVSEEAATDPGWPTSSEIGRPLVVTIHQPEHLPWVPLLIKVALSDVYVSLDHVAFRKNYFHNRNKIRTGSPTSDPNWQWLGVPVRKSTLGTPLDETVVVETASEIENRYLRTIGTTFPLESRVAAEELICQALATNWGNLAELNTALILEVLDLMSVSVETRSSRIIGISSRKSTLVKDICLALGASTYVSGPSGRDYLASAEFVAAGVQIMYVEPHVTFGCSTCESLGSGLRLEMSVLDALAAHPLGRVREWFWHLVTSSRLVDE